MRRLVILAAAFAFALGTGIAMAQTMSTTSGDQASLFCDLCKAQDCSCNAAGDACVNCGGSLTANPGPSADAQVTRRMCQRAKGSFSRGACKLKQK
ncbi:hypothetical protein FQ775_04460 [Nitratireductor mangrovi]|uniref:Uncharacterized protein n=1 Tax=Nitratireductor mangrovi TaxID=2599600 RepID=A0A5B8KVV6_9HYPH|nr:hypothetical protein [Nitratireductor mangrovi]QDY99685.1 hypothetical protein FQ775_04460 [Nitratireductor mangrovi]